MAAAVLSATILLIPLLPGMGDDSSQGTCNQGTMLPAQFLPVTQIRQFLPPPFNLGFPQGRVPDVWDVPDKLLYIYQDT